MISKKLSPRKPDGTANVVDRSLIQIVLIYHELHSRRKPVKANVYRAIDRLRQMLRVHGARARGNGVVCERPRVLALPS